MSSRMWSKLKTNLNTNIPLQLLNMVRFARGSFRSLNRVVVVHRTRDLSRYRDRDEIRATADVLELGEMYVKKNELAGLTCLFKTDTMSQ